MPEDRVLIEFEGEDNTRSATRSAERNIRRIGDQGARSARKIDRNFISLNRTMARTQAISLGIARNLRNAALVSGVAAAAFVGGTALMVRSAVELNSELTTVADTLGITAQQAFTLNELSKGFGITLNQVKAGVLGLAVGAQRLAETEQGAAKFLEFMQISAAEFTALSLPQQIDHLRRTLARTGPEGLQTAIRLGLVEKETSSLFAALAQTNQGLEAMADNFVRTGRAPRQTIVGTLSELETVMNSLGGRFVVLRQEVTGAIAEALIPQLERLDEHMSSPDFQRNRDLFTNWLTERLTPAFQAAGDAAATLFDYFTPGAEISVNPFDPLVTPLVRITDSQFQTDMAKADELIGNLFTSLQQLSGVDFSNFVVQAPTVSLPQDNQNLIPQMTQYLQDAWNGAIMAVNFTIDLSTAIAGISPITIEDIFDTETDVELALKLLQIITGAVAILKRRLGGAFVGLTILDLFSDIGDTDGIDFEGVVSNLIIALAAAIVAFPAAKFAAAGLATKFFTRVAKALNRPGVIGPATRGTFGAITGIIAGAIIADLADSLGASLAEEAGAIAGAIIAGMIAGARGISSRGVGLRAVSGAVTGLFIADMIEDLGKAENGTQLAQGIIELFKVVVSGLIGIANPALGVGAWFALNAVQDIANASRELVTDAFTNFITGSLADSLLELSAGALTRFGRLIIETLIDGITFQQFTGSNLGQKVADFIFGSEQADEELTKAVGDRAAELARLLQVDLSKYDIFLDQNNIAIVRLKEFNTNVVNEVTTLTTNIETALTDARPGLQRAAKDLFNPIQTEPAAVLDLAGSAIDAGLLDVINDVTGFASRFTTASSTAYRGISTEATTATTNARSAFRTGFNSITISPPSFAGVFDGLSTAASSAAPKATNIVSRHLQSYVPPRVSATNVWSSLSTGASTAATTGLSSVTSAITAYVPPTISVKIQTSRTQGLRALSTLINTQIRNYRPPAINIPFKTNPIKVSDGTFRNLDGTIDRDKNPLTPLQTGGIITRPTEALIGEGGEPEAVVPLSQAERFGFGRGGNTYYVVEVNGNVYPNDADEFIDNIVPAMNKAIRQNRIGAA